MYMDNNTVTSFWSASSAGILRHTDCEIQVVSLWRARSDGPFPYVEPAWLSPFYCGLQLMCLLVGCMPLMARYYGLEIEQVGRLVGLPALGILGVLCLLEVSLCSFLGRRWQPTVVSGRAARVLIRGVRYQLRSVASVQAYGVETTWNNIVHPVVQRTSAGVILLFTCVGIFLRVIGLAPLHHVTAVSALIIVLLPFLAAVVWPSSMRLENGSLILARHYPLGVGIRSTTQLDIRQATVFCDLINLEVEIRGCLGSCLLYTSPSPRDS